MSDTPVNLASTLDLLAAAPLKEEIANRAGNGVVLDASGVERLGAQCLQVLLAARAKWRAEKLAFCVINPSATFSEHLRVLGAGDLVNEQTVEEVIS